MPRQRTRWTARCANCLASASIASSSICAVSELLDSTGLRVLLSLRNDAKRDGHSLVLIPGSPAVQRVFALTATRTLFDWRED